MENLKLFGIYVGSIVLFSIIAYILSLNTVKQSIPNVAPLLPKSFSTTTVSIIKGPDITPKVATPTATTTASTSTTTSTTSSYISFLDWPPKIEQSDREFVCSETGLVKIGEENFCVTNVENIVNEKIKNEFIYVKAVASGTAIYTFSTEKSDCQSLPVLQKTECSDGVNKFNLEKKIEDYFQSKI